MARPPAEVSFPGDKNRKRKVRVRGIKKASKQIQQRIDRNLETLLDNPEVFVPDIECELGKPRRDMLAATLRDVDTISKKRHDRRWLGKRMGKRRGDVVGRALAGSLLAAGEADTSTVSVYNSPIYGASSFIRREMGNNPTWLGFRILLTHASGCWSGMIMPRLAGGSSPGTVGLSVRGKSRALLMNG